MSLWKRITFWGKIKDTIGLFGTGGQVVLLIADVPHLYNYITAGATALGMLVALWFDDRDGNGLVDIFETEVKTTTTITSASPIEVTTTEETTKQ